MTAWATNPQAVQIDALIERAGLLSPVEWDRLAAARAAAWEAAWEAAWFAAAVAARAAAWEAAWEAARDAAWDAAWFGSWAAAWFGSWAAEALVVRDLIDEATPWNRAAYDLLTGPWRRIIGPIHPDDEVLR